VLGRVLRESCRAGARTHGRPKRIHAARADERHAGPQDFTVMNDSSTHSSRLSHIRVRDCMHHGVLSCGPDDPLRDVAATMANHRVHAVLITDREGGRPLGMVSDLDVAAAAARGEDQATAREAAGAEPLTVSSAAPVQDAARLMSDQRVGHLVVVDSASGYPAGVISTLDVASIYAGR
jgi:CBS domain-containing protein